MREIDMDEIPYGDKYICISLCGQMCDDVITENDTYAVTQHLTFRKTDSTNLWGDKVTLYQNIARSVDQDFSDSKVRDALNYIYAYMQKNGTPTIIMDLAKVDASLAPAKEMTIEEIQKELGYKIKIVEGKKKNEQ